MAYKKSFKKKAKGKRTYRKRKVAGSLLVTLPMTQDGLLRFADTISHVSISAAPNDPNVHVPLPLIAAGRLNLVIACNMLQPYYKPPLTSSFPNSNVGTLPPVPVDERLWQGLETWKENYRQYIVSYFKGQLQFSSDQIPQATNDTNLQIVVTSWVATSAQFITELNGYTTRALMQQRGARTYTLTGIGGHNYVKIPLRMNMAKMLVQKNIYDEDHNYCYINQTMYTTGVGAIAQPEIVNQCFFHVRVQNMNENAAQLAWQAKYSARARFSSPVVRLANITVGSSSEPEKDERQLPVIASPL